MSGSYLLVKWLHVAGAAILLGTGIGIAFHLWIALRGGNVATIAAAARATVHAVQHALYPPARLAAWPDAAIFWLMIARAA